MGVTVGMLMAITIFLFVVLYPPNVSQLRDHIGVLFVAAIFCIVFPVLIFFINARKLFTIIKIDENGISRSLFGKFFKLSMKWDEIYEISYYESVLPFLMFSQTKSLKGISYNGTAKIKNLIQLQLTRKNYNFIKQYIKQPIVGLTDDKIKRLKLDK